MNKKLNSKSSAGTTADSDKTPKIPTSSHACSNTFVIGSQGRTVSTYRNRSYMEYRGIKIVQSSPIEPVNEHFQYSSKQYLRICREGLMQRLFRLFGLRKLL